MLSMSSDVSSSFSPVKKSFTSLMRFRIDWKNDSVPAANDIPSLLWMSVFNSGLYHVFVLPHCEKLFPDVLQAPPMAARIDGWSVGRMLRDMPTTCLFV